MRRYFKMNQMSTDEVLKQEQADQVLMSRDELDSIERKLQNKVEEADRWRKRVTGEDLEYKIVTVDYIHEKQAGVGIAKNMPVVFLVISLPFAYIMSKEIKDQVKSHVEHIFSQYIKPSKGYKLHFSPKAGWSVHLQLTEEELDSFRLPN